MDILEQKIKELEAFKGNLETQQVMYPLDPISKANLDGNVLVPNGDTLSPVGLGTWDESIEIDINGRKYLLYSSSIQ